MEYNRLNREGAKLKKTRKPRSPLDVEALQDLTTKMAGITDPVTMHRLLEELLTPTECRDLSLRWRLLEHLKLGVPQRRIAKDLGISLCKITRGSSVLKKSGSICAKLLSESDDNETENQVK